LGEVERGLYGPDESAGQHRMGGAAMTTAQQAKDKARPGKGGKQKAARQGGRQAATTAKAGSSGVTVPVPIVIPRLKVYHPPVLGNIGQAGRSVAGRLPPPGRLAFYGGRGAAAVFGVIGWPVAVAIGAGTAIARRARAGDQPEQPEPAISSTTGPQTDPETDDQPS
jgi:hypothetical protein